MPKQRKEHLQDTPQDETAQQLKALQDENMKLRIENAYLDDIMEFEEEKGVGRKNNEDLL